VAYLDIFIRPILFFTIVKAYSYTYVPLHRS
jgi:hypothetical protein